MLIKISQRLIDSARKQEEYRDRMDQFERDKEEKRNNWRCPICNEPLTHMDKGVEVGMYRCNDCEKNWIIATWGVNK